LAVLALPFVVNDVAYIQAESAEQWLLADYVSKAVPLAVALMVPSLRRTVRSALAPARPVWECGLWTAATFAFVLALYHYVKAPLDGVFPESALFSFPAIERRWLFWFDMTAGLALTAVSEEIVFRGLFRSVVERLGGGPAAAVLVSSLAFAAVHWSNGVGSLVFSFLAGAVLMALYMRTGSLVPPIAAHYAVDAVLFA
jgi:membrane protease YdiL (CAAX protease family)